jgi:phage internal scaffolding protein
MRIMKLYDRVRPAGICKSGECVTQQHFKNDVNINSIMEKYRTTGVLPVCDSSKAVYGDFTGIDYQGARNMIAESLQGFMTLPARLRARFDNDPAKLIAFIQDESNKDEAIALGIMKVIAENTPKDVKSEEPAPSST